ncbi:sorting nexin-17 [Zootermopsis nevadensis]|uniref:Sorting nexin-17 n=1 Tax=Zootermopsis nevadensis TaxID=136037 RepID=A0A067RCT0_ZOONE|nr:sorting nexin-17 [Zootermopsis nevadensis]KDR21557.1 Sorting nexin-17 [Zootermopsis nevadensis]
MHFSIPDTEEFSDESGSTYMGYNIHINGVFHCTVRYRQLHNLHEQLKKEYGANNLPVFPPKKLLPLSSSQLEERRAMLEKYIQSVGQDPRLVNTDLFNGFLLSAQQETSCEKSQEVPLDVFLMNGYKISLNVVTTERSDQVLEKACHQLNLPNEYVYYFSLFLINREEDGDITILRKLQDFESPYISEKSIQGVHRVVLRKSYWDPGYDLELMSNQVALNMLYVQTVADVERGWVLSSKETKHQLASLQARGAKKEYLDLARTLKYYGFLQFRPCLCDYPHPGSRVLVSAGNRELNLRIRLAEGQDMREGSFKVARMRCWRITTLHNNGQMSTGGSSSSSNPQLELSFEYLMSRDKLQWITIASEQAILMSVCLQAMVDELLLKKTGMKRKQPGDKVRKGSWSYMKRDGSSQLISVSQSASSDAICSNISSANGDVKSPSKNEFSTSSMRKLSEKLSSVTLKSSSKQTPHPFVENDAFECIGDEDL